MSKNWIEKSLLYKLFYTEIWEIAILKAEFIAKEDFFTREKNLLKKAYFIKNIKAKTSYSFVADPFGVFYNDNYYIYYEYLNYRNKKGEIRYQKYDKKFNLLKTGTALNKSYHLSYPYLFTEDNKLYLLPEMTGCKSGKQAIFVCNSNNDWKEISINIPALVDPTMLKEKSSYLIFGSLGGKKIVYSSTKILGEYKELIYISYHDYSQSGGKIFRINNSIYRPLQISDKTYGEKILLVKLNITKHQVEEDRSKTILMSEEYAGFHTFSPIDKDYIVVDIKRFKCSIFKFIISIQKNINKKIRKKRI